MTVWIEIAAIGTTLVSISVLVAFLWKMVRMCVLLIEATTSNTKAVQNLTNRVSALEKRTRVGPPGVTP